MKKTIKCPTCNGKRTIHLAGPQAEEGAVGRRVAGKAGHLPGLPWHGEDPDMTRRLGLNWSGARGRDAVRILLRITREERYDLQVRVNAAATVLQCCGEDAEPPKPTRAVGFTRGEE